VFLFQNSLSQNARAAYSLWIMGGELGKLLLTLIPMVGLSVGGLYVAKNCSGLLSAAGWIAFILFGLLAGLQSAMLISGLRFKNTPGKSAMELEAEAEMAAQGESIDEVMAQNKKSKS
jgi:hypothetical protein